MNDNKNKVFYIEEEQKISLENEINESLNFLETIFNKEDLLKFLFKNIEDGKYDFNEKNEDNQDNSLTEEEISAKKDKLCRKIKEIFDTVNPKIFLKYQKRFGTASVKISKEIFKRRKIINNPKRKVKLEKIKQDCTEKKMVYTKLDGIKDLIKETIYISSFYNKEIVNKNGLLFQNLNKFYDEKNDIEITNNINGEEKIAKEDEIIKKVVKTKENIGKQFIIDTKNFINETNKEQMLLNVKMSDLAKEMKDLKKQKDIFEKYCNDNNNGLKDLNEFDYYG